MYTYIYTHIKYSIYICVCMSIYRTTSKLYCLKDTLKNIVKSKCSKKKNVEVTYSKTRRRKQKWKHRKWRNGRLKSIFWLTVKGLKTWVKDKDWHNGLKCITQLYAIYKKPNLNMIKQVESKRIEKIYVEKLIVRN